MSQIQSWLPPNLQPPQGKTQIPMLILKIKQIAYLQLLSQKLSSVRYKWWGLKSKQQQFPLEQNNKQLGVHSFYIAVSKPMFLRYCLDMKVLQFQLCDSTSTAIAKGYLNFMLLKGWAGEPYQVLTQIKGIKNMKKIGQIRMQIQIKQVQNKYHNEIIHRQTIQNIHNRQQSQSGQGKNTIKNVTINQSNRELSSHNRADANVNVNVDGRNGNGNGNRNGKRNSIEQNQCKQYNFINFRNIQQQNIDVANLHQPAINRQRMQRQLNQWKSTRRQILPTDDTKTRWYKMLDLPLPVQCICDQMQKYNSNYMQKFRLRQELDLLFKTTNNYASTEHVNIQFIGWQPINKNNKQVTPCRIVVPLLDSQGKIYKNQHYFGNGKGNIAIDIDSNIKQNIIKDYLTNQQIVIQVGDNFTGSVALFKIIGSKGDIVSTTICQKNKNNKQIMKGHYFLKLIPNIKVETKQQITNDIRKKQNNEAQIQHNNDRIRHQKQQYIWIYLRQLHFLQPHHWPNSNLYALVKTVEQNYKTKTIWKTDSPAFNQIVALKMPYQPILIEIWNRQATERLVGKAYVKISDVSSSMQAPVFDAHNRTIAYLNLCFGKGDLAAATQFINTHSRPTQYQNQQQSNGNSLPYNSPRTQPYRQNINGTKSNQDQSSSEHQHESQNSSEHISPRPSPHSSSQSSHQKQPIVPILPAPEEQLDILQLHNVIFTCYLAHNYDWLSTYQNRQPTMAEFWQLLKPICQQINHGRTKVGHKPILWNNNVAKFVSIYLNTQNNTVNLKQINDSFQAFQVYYNILSQQRNVALANAIEYLNEQGISINQIENSLGPKLRKGKNNKQNYLWRGLKQYLDPYLVQKLRYFYQHVELSQLCDCFRKFEVYQTTAGEKVGKQMMGTQILKQIADILQVDAHLPSLKQAIKQSGLELSKYELLSIFGEITLNKQKEHQSGNKQSRQKQAQMTKSPTFGILATDRIKAPTNLKPDLKIEGNPSLGDRLQFQQQSKQKSGVSMGLSQKFGHPNISPINRNRTKTVLIKFADLTAMVSSIQLNGKQYALGQSEVLQDGQIAIEMEKQFSYQGVLVTQHNDMLEFDGPPGQWIALMDQNGQYCGSICFN